MAGIKSFQPPLNIIIKQPLASEAAAAWYAKGKVTFRSSISFNLLKAVFRSNSPLLILREILLTMATFFKSVDRSDIRISFVFVGSEPSAEKIIPVGVT